MSIGPTLEKEEFKAKLFTRLTNSVKKSTEVFFIDPLHYIFYTALSLVLIVLLAGMRISIAYYIILAILGAVKAGLYIANERRNNP